MMRALAGAAGVEAPSVRWRYAHDEPWFDNQVATLELDGRHARVVLEKTERHEGESAEDGASASSACSSTTSADTASTETRKERANAPSLRFLRHGFHTGIIIG